MLTRFLHKVSDAKLKDFVDLVTIPHDRIFSRIPRGRRASVGAGPIL